MSMLKKHFNVAKNWCIRNTRNFAIEYGKYFKYSSTFTIIKLFLNEKEWPEMCKSADDCKTIIIWADD